MVSQPGPAMPMAPRALLISPFSGFIKTSKVKPTPMTLTRTGKKMTDLRYPRAMIREVSITASAMPRTTLMPEVITA